ncbi:MAG: hypothetical protein LBL96_05910 [Clostridiales bacterium]|jgi:hypothetical protein|nr:hypothetical protein [Clostridiales bacterium]
MHKASTTVELALLFPMILGALLFLFVFILLMYQDAAFAAKLNNNALRISNSLTDDDRKGDGKISVPSLYRESKDIYANSDAANITAVYMAQVDYSALQMSIMNDLSTVSLLKWVEETSELSLERQGVTITVASSVDAPVPFIGNLGRETEIGAYSPIINPSVYIRNSDASALMMTKIYEKAGYWPISASEGVTLADTLNYQHIYDNLRSYAQSHD